MAKIGNPFQFLRAKVEQRKVAKQAQAAPGESPVKVKTGTKFFGLGRRISQMASNLKQSLSARFSKQNVQLSRAGGQFKNDKSADKYAPDFGQRKVVDQTATDALSSFADMFSDSIEPDLTSEQIDSALADLASLDFDTKSSPPERAPPPPPTALAQPERELPPLPPSGQIAKFNPFEGTQSKELEAAKTYLKGIISEEKLLAFMNDKSAVSDMLGKIPPENKGNSLIEAQTFIFHAIAYNPSDD